MPLAVPLAAGPTRTHTSAHCLCFCPSLETARSRHTRHPWLLFKKKKQRKSFWENKIRKQASCGFRLVFIISLQSCFLFFSEQVAGPPAAGAYRERPSRPTSFRRSYERRELPVALLHDTKGQQIAWKVRRCAAGCWSCSSHAINWCDGMIGLHLSTMRQPLMAKFPGV